jgi:hypothetical protein
MTGGMGAARYNVWLGQDVGNGAVDWKTLEADRRRIRDCPQRKSAAATLFRNMGIL